MKMFLLLALSVTALFIWQRKGNEPVPAPKPPLVTQAVATTTPRPVSAHNWAKNALDRTHAVMDQVQDSREQDNQR